MPVTGHGPASRTVTRSTRPSSMKSWVIPSFLARIAGIRSPGEADLDVDAGGQVVEALERVDRLRRRLMDVDQPLVGADLKVLARVLVLERAADDAVHVLLGRERDGTGHGRAGALSRLDDLAGSLLNGRRLVSLEPDPDFVLCESCHLRSPLSVVRAGLTSARPSQASVRPEPYSWIPVTTPEPTVRPPSRMAKRRPSSMAIGWISSIVISTLSPGMTISVPSGRLATPVTSVVRK